MSMEGAAPTEVVAGYRIEQLIGRGGMGEVYRALDIALDRPVALKLLRLELRADDRFRDRMLRESRLAASLDHPNVVPIYEAGEADGRLFIAMRYVDGTDLRTALRREGRLAPERAVRIADQVAEALDAAHARGLVHRDVKASNVLIDQVGRREHCYLADFGLTQSASDTGPTDGHFMGTVDYVAPEQIRGEEMNGRADQYALGCLLFELLTGTLPFSGSSDLAVVFAHLQELPPRASERNSQLPLAIDPVLERALAKDPGQRYPGCRELVDEAAAALGVSREQRPRRLWLLAAVAALSVAVAAWPATDLLTGSGKPAGPVSGALVHIDPVKLHITTRDSLIGYPGAVAAAGASVWVADFRNEALWRFTPQTGSFTRVPISGEPRDIAVLGSKVYVASDGPNPLSGTVTRYDAGTGQRESGVEVPFGACAIAAGDAVAWVAGCPFIERLSTDDRQLRLTRKVFIPYASPLTAANDRVQFRALTIGAGSLWVLGDALDSRLWQLDPDTGAQRSTMRLGFPPRSLAFADGRVWITDPLDDNVVAVDPQKHTIVARIHVCRGAAGIAALAGALWVACSLDNAVERLSAQSRRITQTVQIPGSPLEVATAKDGVWVTVDETS